MIAAAIAEHTLSVAHLRAQLAAVAARAQALAAAIPADLDAADLEVRHRVARGIVDVDAALLQVTAAAGLVRRG